MVFDQKDSRISGVIGFLTVSSGTPLTGLFAGKRASTHSFSAYPIANAVWYTFSSSFSGIFGSHMSSASTHIGYGC